jgi:phage gpG-like protein
MIGLKVRTTDNTKAVHKAVDKAAFKNFNHAAASISKDVKSTLEKADGASEPGQPPHTHKGIYLRRAIRFASDKEGAVIGPMASVVDQAGAVHEFGGDYKGNDYPERPFMYPALQRALPRFAGQWRGSIGE